MPEKRLSWKLGCHFPKSKMKKTNALYAWKPRCKTTKISSVHTGNPILSTANKSASGFSGNKKIREPHHGPIDHNVQLFHKNTSRFDCGNCFHSLPWKEPASHPNFFLHIFIHHYAGCDDAIKHLAVRDRRHILAQDG